MTERYFNELANAFVRGKLGQADATVKDGINAGLRLHKFKVNSGLPRVQRILGILHRLAPESLLDVGSGRALFCGRCSTHFPNSVLQRLILASGDPAILRRYDVEELKG